MILKRRLQQRLGRFMPHIIFFDMFFKKVEKIYVDLYNLKERFNKTEIEVDSENKSQLKRI